MELSCGRTIRQVHEAQVASPWKPSHLSHNSPFTAIIHGQVLVDDS